MFFNRFRAQLLALPLGVLLLAPSGHAQGTSPATDTALPIFVPPGVKVDMEVDARQNDVLGLVKSLLKGMGGAAAPGQPAGLGGPPPGDHGGDPEDMFFSQLLTGGHLEAILKNVNHVHFKVMMPAQGARPDLREIYEKPMLAEHGHRIAWLDFGANQLLMVGFDGSKGFAAATYADGRLIVLRSDGFPDLEALAPVLKIMYFTGSMTRIDNASPTTAAITTENKPDAAGNP